MYEAIEHWKQYQQEKRKYPNKAELMAQGYEVPGAMLLDELREYEEAQEEKEKRAMKMTPFLIKLVKEKQLNK